MRKNKIAMIISFLVGCIFAFSACENSSEQQNLQQIPVETQLVVKTGLDIPGNLHGKIAFISYDRVKSNNHLLILNLDKGNLIDITPLEIIDITNPVWSPDGEKIAFEGYFQGVNSIFIIDENGSNLLQITKDNNARFPSWSPDGNYILFASTSSKILNSSGKRVLTIFRKSLDGMEMEHLQIIDRPINISIIGFYRTDGLISISESVTRYSFSNYVAGFDGSIKTDINGFNSTAIPKWSPDNEYVLLTKFESYCTGIYIKKSFSDDWGCLFIATENQEIIHANTATWSPDGKHILFSSEFGNSERINNLFIVNMNGSNFVQITDLPIDANNATWFDD